MSPLTGQTVSTWDNHRTWSGSNVTLPPSLLSSSSDPGCNNSGYYELLAVLTHQGRSSSSGHYVGWVRHREGEEGGSSGDW